MIREDMLCEEIDRLRDLDALRCLELADTDAALAESNERGRLAKELVMKLADRVYAAHEVLGNRAERRVWVVSEVDYPTEGL